MSKPLAKGATVLSLSAPLELSELDCSSCPVGCSSEFHLVELCPLIQREYPSGALLASRGEPADSLWFVKSGAVAGSWLGHEAQLLFGTGSIVGLECLVSDTRLVTAWTVAPTRLCGIARASFGAWLERRGELADTLTAAAHALVAESRNQRRSVK